MHTDKSLISLNFFTLIPQSFSYKVFRKIYGGEIKSGEFNNCFKSNLPINILEDINIKENRADYWVAFDSQEGFEEFICNADYNFVLTKHFLLLTLKKRCEEKLDKLDYIIPKNEFRNFVTFNLKSYPEGCETVWLEPYYLRSEKVLGFLVDFEFSKNENVPFSRRIQQLSLSLDKSSRSNRDFYIDRYARIKSFLKLYYPQIFPIPLSSSTKLDILTTLREIPSGRLDTKQYIFASGKEKASQFNGIKEFGPLEPIRNRVGFYFICLEEDISFANSLYKALKGETFPTSFPGMEKMFQVFIEQSFVKGKRVKEFNKEVLQETISELKTWKETAGIGIVIPILILRSKNDEDSNRLYYLAKYLFINENIPLQVVTLDVLKNTDILKWSISNIGLQIFSKLGGIPWKVKPRNEECLIIGIGQAHKEYRDGGLIRIEKYFAYSVLADSSGQYVDLKILSEANERQDYLEDLKMNLKGVIESYKGSYRKIVIHTPFKIKKYELMSIKETIESFTVGDENKTEFVVLKVNTKNKFFGYDLSANSLIPYESTCLKLSDKEYLLWFEGLQYHNPNVTKRYSGPTLIEFFFKTDINGLDNSYLQDVLNLSGANWRGFNAKSLPVSIYYCQLVAKFIKEFNSRGYKEYSLNNLHPWFL